MRSLAFFWVNVWIILVAIHLFHHKSSILYQSECPHLHLRLLNFIYHVWTKFILKKVQLHSNKLINTNQNKEIAYLSIKTLFPRRNWYILAMFRAYLCCSASLTLYPDKFSWFFWVWPILEFIQYKNMMKNKISSI